MAVLFVVYLFNDRKDRKEKEVEEWTEPQKLDSL
jgi:hypothetical protein